MVYPEPRRGLAHKASARDHFQRILRLVITAADLEFDPGPGLEKIPCWRYSDIKLINLAWDQGL